jgi:hypothetical protein
MSSTIQSSVHICPLYEDSSHWSSEPDISVAYAAHDITLQSLAKTSLHAITTIGSSLMGNLYLKGTHADVVAPLVLALAGTPKMV